MKLFSFFIAAALVAVLTGEKRNDCDDVLEENKILKEEVKRLNGIIETNITTLFSLVQQNKERIDGNEVRIDDDEQLIRFNIERIDGNEERIQGNERRIQNHETNITTNKGKTILNEISINNNKVTLEDVVNDVENLRTAPIGSIIAWVNKPSKDTTEYADIPEGWVRCDGTTIPHPSIWAGQKTPDLNSAESKRFLRGGPDMDMLNMEEDQLQDHKHNINDPGHKHGYKDHHYSPDIAGYGPEGSNHKGDSFDIETSHTSDSSSTGITVENVESSYRRGTETRPKNMNVIFILRVA